MAQDLQDVKAVFSVETCDCKGVTEALQSKIIRALDSANDIGWQFQLIGMALEAIEDGVTEKNFDRIQLLLEHYQSSFECNFEDLKEAILAAQRLIQQVKNQG